MSRDACFALYRDALGNGVDEEASILRWQTSKTTFTSDFDFEQNRYEFACKLLRDWWLRHYGLEAI